MQVLRLCLAVACLLVWDWPAVAADPQPVGQVEHVPPEEAFAILGSPVAGPDGKTIGRLVDVLVDASGTPQAGVIDVGGFMGVGARKIAVHWSTLHFAPANPRQPITLDLTLDQIKSAPEYRNPNAPAPVVLPAKAPGTTAGPTTGSPVIGSPAGGSPTAGSPTAGSPAAGRPAAGSPTAGSPTAGGPTAGSPTAGGPTAGSPTAGRPTAGSPTTGGGTLPSGTPSNGATASGTTGSVPTSETTTSSGAAGNAAPGAGTMGNEPARQTTPPRSP